MELWLIDVDRGSLSSLREAVLRALNSLTPGYPEEVADPEVVADMVLTVLKFVTIHTVKRPFGRYGVISHSGYHSFNLFQFEGQLNRMRTWAPCRNP